MVPGFEQRGYATPLQNRKSQKTAKPARTLVDGRPLGGKSPKCAIPTAVDMGSESEIDNAKATIGDLRSRLDMNVSLKAGMQMIAKECMMILLDEAVKSGMPLCENMQRFYDSKCEFFPPSEHSGSDSNRSSRAGSRGSSCCSQGSRKSSKSNASDGQDFDPSDLTHIADLSKMVKHDKKRRRSRTRTAEPACKHRLLLLLHMLLPHLRMFR